MLAIYNPHAKSSYMYLRKFINSSCPFPPKNINSSYTIKAQNYAGINNSGREAKTLYACYHSCMSFVRINMVLRCFQLARLASVSADLSICMSLHKGAFRDAIADVIVTNESPPPPPSPSEAKPPGHDGDPSPLRINDGLPRLGDGARVCTDVRLSIARYRQTSLQ